MRSEEIAPLLVGADGPGLNLHIGLISKWDDTTGSNEVMVSGRPLTNLSVLASAGLTALVPGTTVLIQKWKSTWVILGRIVTQASGLASPQFPIVLYPLFRPNGLAGATGHWQVNAGVLASWEGRARISYPAIMVDGIWGVSTGTGTVTYEARVGGVVVGSWSFSSPGLSVSRHGPFRVDEFIGNDWEKVEVVITASTGTGERAFQVLGAYFQQITT